MGCGTTEERRGPDFRVADSTANLCSQADSLVDGSVRVIALSVASRNSSRPISTVLCLLIWLWGVRHGCTTDNSSCPSCGLGMQLTTPSAGSSTDRCTYRCFNVACPRRGFNLVARGTDGYLGTHTRVDHASALLVAYQVTHGDPLERNQREFGSSQHTVTSLCLKVCSIIERFQTADMMHLKELSNMASSTRQ